MRKWLYLGLAALVCSTAAAQDLGIFTDTADIGEPVLEGAVTFENGAYEIEGGGATIGRNSFTDQFFFVYREISGNFAIESDIFSLAADGEGGLMIRQDLDPDSVHASLLRTAENIPPGGNTNAALGSVFPHFRSLKGGGTIVDGDYEPGGITEDNIGPIRLIRMGNSVHYYTMDDEGNWLYRQTEFVQLTDPVLAGLAVTANAEEGLGVFSFEAAAIEEMPASVVRSIPAADYPSDGGTIEGVTLTASVREGETADLDIVELAPRGSTIANMSASAGEAEMSDGNIAWTLAGFSGEATLTYDITLPAGHSTGWPGTFDDGVNPVSLIGGDSILPKAPTFTPYEAPVELDPDGVTLLEIERGQPVRDEGDWGILADPRLTSGLGAVAMSGAVAGWMEFPVNIPEDYGDIYLFGNVRGEDGNSDSFFVEIQFEPINDDLTIWDSGGGKSFHLDWVANRLGEDPRPFFGIDAGENFVYISPRETASSIDWLAVTNNPALNISLFDDFTGDFANPIPFANVNVENPSPKPMENGEVFFEAEEGNLIVTPPDGDPHFSVLPDLSVPGRLFVINDANITSGYDPENRLDYTFEVFEPGAYRVIARTRTPSGSDDSFWVGMDFEEITAESLDDAFSGSGNQDNQFHNSWVESNNIPGMSWELDAGVHTFNLYAREDGTMIDWLIITNNLEQDPTLAVPPSDETPVAEYMLY